MVKIKVCGITNIEDALASISYGADLLGFNFYTKSPRYISPNAASSIIAKLANVHAVGVFVNEKIEDILAIITISGITAIQLHGNEPPEYVANLTRRTSLPIIKAFQLSEDFDLAYIPHFAVEAILLDAHSPTLFGGSGDVADWNTAHEIAKVHSIYLAGGLTPENVSTAIEMVRPYAVDVCSGVEAEKGKKDYMKLKLFIENARLAI